MDEQGKRRKKAKKASSDLVEVLPEASRPKAIHNDDLDLYSPENAIDNIPLSLWIELDGCDPVPIYARGGLTVHDLKLLLGGFPTASHQGNPRSRGAEVNIESQRQQIELLGLRGVRPQQIKMRLNDKSLSPPDKLHLAVPDGATVHLSLVPSPISTSLASSSTASSSSGALSATTADPETMRMIYEMRHELDNLRRRLYTSASDSTAPGALLDLRSSGEVNANGSMTAAERTPLATHLEVLEAKIDIKNST
jgi:hypothetical protein